MAKIQRKKLEADTGQGQLIIEIFENHGRTEGVCNKTGLSESLVSYWRATGHVPLSRVGRLSRALKENIYAFNYEGVGTLLGKAPEWEDVVKACKLSENRTKLVLSKPAPMKLKHLI